MRARRAWVVVDMTNDFVASDGALTCGEAGQAIVAPLLLHLEQARDNDELIIFACDAHMGDDPEFSLWPVHCVAGTEGAALYGDVRAFYERYRGERVRYMPKTRYDAFFETPLAQWLQEDNVTEVVVAGVCTSICCYATASGAYYRRLSVLYDQQAMADLSDTAHQFAVQQMTAVLKARPWQASEYTL
ncbi:MAG: cysteine hydrolase [Firmicutes bacterium]|nr:cysteine hydrolase [Bacillota bacterium]